MSNEKKSIKIGNTSFNIEAVKAMKLKGFKETYSKIKAFEGKDLDALYAEITGQNGNVG